MVTTNSQGIAADTLPGSDSLSPEVRALLNTIIDSVLALANVSKGNSNEGSNPFGVAPDTF